MCTCNRTAPPDREILPSHLKPLHYDLKFDPCMKTFTFKGEATIDLLVQDSSVHYIELNTLEISDIVATVGNVSATKLEDIPETQRTRIYFPVEVFTKGKEFQLYLTFNGVLNDKMAGFYRSKYNDSVTGEEKYMISTQFEATDARRAFPCFDEPNLKAKFTITLKSAKNLVQLSNMDVASEVIENDTKTTKFNTTPLMSTYLVAFVIGEFVGVPSKYDYRIPVTTWTIPGTEKSAQYSADFTAKCLEFYEKTFDIEYPLPKMDSVLIKEFAAGAMENYGLITYRDTALMLDLENSTISEQFRVAEVVAHEVSHQWFGNLATMDWWSCLYLNESGATFWSWFCCNHFKPEWKVWEHFVTESLQEAFALDGLRSSHQVEVDVSRADEINQIFDSISYAKGGSLLRMMANWLGEETFVQGVANYLREFSYKNAVTEDLWNHLGLQSGKPVPKIMDIWTKKVGYPILTVEELQDNKLKLTQHRFLKTGDVKSEDDTTLYPIIPFVKTGSDGKIDKDTVLYERENFMTLTDKDFYKINGNQAGFFVTCYPESRYEKLGKQADLLSVEDRAGLIGELQSIAAAGYASTATFLALLKNWKKESSPAVWSQMLSSLGTVKAAWMFQDEKTVKALKTFTIDLISDKLNELGWEVKTNDSFETKSLKIELFASACTSGVSKYTDICLESFNKYYEGDSSAIDPLHKDIVFATVALDGKQENFDKLFKIYKKNNNDKINALKAIGRFDNPEIIPKIIKMLLDGTVTSQDIIIPLSMLRASKEGVEALWAWLQENWSILEERFPGGLNLLSMIVKICTISYTSLDKIKEIELFFKDKNCKGFDRALAQSIDAITSKAQWVNRDVSVVEHFLKSNNYYS